MTQAPSAASDAGQAGAGQASDASSPPIFAQIQGDKPSTNISDLAQQTRALQQRRNDSPYESNTVGKTIVGACARARPIHPIGGIRPPATPDDPYCVGGKPYMDAESIPGNNPVPLTDGAGHAVSGSDGQPVYGPSSGVSSMDGIANRMDNNWNFLQREEDLEKFRRAQVWDFQRVKDDDGSIIFTRKYTEFANIIIGYADAKGANSPIIGTEAAAEWGARGGKYNEPMSTKYPRMPKRIETDIKIGRDLRQTRPPNPSDKSWSR